MLRTLYSWVDYNYITSEGVSTPWNRTHISRLDEVLKDGGRRNTYSSIQYYKTDKHEVGELQFVPIYFDFDYPDDVEVALIDCREVVNYFGQMEIGQEHIRIYFSGSKGFHVVISPEVFGIKPHEELTYIIKNACLYVANHLKLKSFDHRVYSIRRMWRMPESQHQKTGLYCTEISRQELQLSLAEIKLLAVTPRGSLYDDSEYEQIEENTVCRTWFSVFIQQYENQKELQNLRPKNTISTIPGENPVCVTDLLNNSIRKNGTRNQAEMALASYFKDTGVDAETAFPVIYDFVQKIPKGLTSMTDKRSLEADVKGVVRTVFDPERGDNYHFACHFIRALGSGTDKPIACAHEHCKFIQNPDDQEPEKIIELKLPEASRSVYINKRIKTEVMVSGREEIPYGIPSLVNIKCRVDLSADNSICHNCGIASFGGSFEFKFSAKDKNILNLLDTSDLQQKQFIRRRCGIPDRCPRHVIHVREWTNAVEIHLIPRVDFRPDTITDYEPYVVRRAFFIGHDVESNKEYSITAYTYPDPRNQQLVHVIDEMIPLTDDIAKFDPEPEMLERLKKFQVTNIPNGVQ